MEFKHILVPIDFSKFSDKAVESALHMAARYQAKITLAHKEIFDFVNERNTDLLIMASHGFTGIEYILLGSTAEKVIRLATCPVLTVKSKGY